MDFAKKCRSGLYASIIGDALGVPVETTSRQELALCAVKNMFGFGRYDQPKGTWSDDSSMILCTMDSLSKGYNLDDLGATFCEWLFNGKWTPYGYPFDSGVTTVTALESIYSKSKTVHESGGVSEDDNGNGSLMRILPAALYFNNEPTKNFLEKIHEISAVTHAHPRSKIGCGIFSLIVKHLLEENDKNAAYRSAVEEAVKYYSADSVFKNELNHYSRVISLDITHLVEDEIYSSGYIVHTLEAALWCFLRLTNTKEILLAAVNLGLDTDTTGTVAGGFAGIQYGLESIPRDWINTLARKDEIEGIITKFVGILKDYNEKENL